MIGHGLNHHLATQARNAVTVAAAHGELTRAKDQPCESCGETAAILHHHDYSRPFDVIPLCRTCHGGVHSGKIPEPRTGRVYVAIPKERPPAPERPPPYVLPPIFVAGQVEPVKTVGEYLRWKRGSQPLAWIAKRADCSVQAISQWERGEKSPSQARLRTLGDALGFDADDWQRIGLLQGGLTND